MTTWGLYNGTLIAPEGMRPDAGVWITGETIQQIGTHPPEHIADAVDAQGGYILPGFIDVHIHGGAGADTMDATPAALATLSRHCAAHGVTGFLATTMSATREALTAALEAIAAAQRDGPLPGARLLGAHLEGPYLATEQAGAQPRAHLRPADPAEYRPWLASGVVRMLTLAPELPANHALIREASAQGICVVAGHTAATYEELLAAAPLGLSGVTHLGNAMTAFHHRRPGALGAALTCDDLHAQLIADRVHLHPAAVALFIRAKTPARILLITDATRAAGLGDGDFTLGETPITVRDGIARTADGALAGSTLTMDAAVRNLLADTNLGLEAIAQMAATNPARALGLAAQTGSLAPGKAADLVLLDRDTLAVRMTVVAGRIVHTA